MKPRRLVLITSGLDVGGSELQLCQLAVGLADREWAISVISLQRGGRYADMLRAHKVAVFEHPVGRLASPWAFLRLRRAIQRLRPDVVHTQAFRANLWGRLAALLDREPVVASVRATYSYLPKSYYPIERGLSRRTQKILVPSLATGRHLVQKVGVPAEKIATIVNGVDAKFFENVDNGEVFRQRWALGGKFVLLAPGRLTPQKNHLGVLEAYRVFADRFPDSALVIAGAGPLNDALRGRADEVGKCIVFVGELDRSDLSSAMIAADAVVLASTFEGMPNVLLEAMACRRPVIATDVDGSTEVVSDGVDGFLVTPGDTRELVEAMSRLASSAKIRRDFGEAGRRKVETSFTIARNLDEHVRVYEAIVARHSSVAAQS